MTQAGPADCEHAGFVVLRTPLLAYDELAAWCGPVDPRDGLTAARRALGRLLELPEVAEALHLASPNLFESLPAWRAQPDSERGRRIERSLVRYVSRMAVRPTPFGTLAGCTVGGVGVRTRLVLPPRARYERHSRLDTEYLCALVAELQRHPELRPELRFRPNSSLYALGDRLHLAEWRPDGQSRTYQLVAVDRSEYLDSTLERAARGATARELADALAAADPDIAADEAAGFIGELIDSQVLVSELEPQITGAEPLESLLARLLALQPARAAADVLTAARGDLAALDAGGIGAEPARYAELAERLGPLPVAVDPSRMVQVDLFKPAEGLELGKAVIDEVRRGIGVLRRLTREGSDRIAKFRDAFVNRYEQRGVALTAVLDEEAGIGFDLSSAPATDASPLLAGLTFPEPEAEARVSWGRRETHLYRRLCDVLSSGAEQLDLTDDDLRAMEHRNPPPLPDAFAAMVRLAAESCEAVDAGRFRVAIDLASGPSGAVLLGRFCHGDARLTGLVREHLRREEAMRPEAIFAEIVHLPEGRLGNVILRPVLRDYEIPYQGASGAALDRQIPISDLWVSVEGERVVLRSRRLGREIVPRLSCAHNYQRRSLGLYRFLCALQTQGCAGGLIWTWGALESAPFLPRVTHGRIVLSRARWLLGKREVERLAAGLKGDWFAETQRWRAARRVPRFAVLSEEDNELFVDFDQPASVDMLLHQLAGQEAAVLLEMFPQPGELAVRGPEGGFTSEFVIPFTRTPQRAAPEGRTDAPAGPSAASPPTAAAEGAPSAVSRAPADVAREFAPGSQWLYAKIYCGPAGADRVLRDVVRPLLDDAATMCDRWFFIRYGDPDWHLRLRLRADPAALMGAVAPRLHQLLKPALFEGLSYRVAFDTYQREIERYGGPAGIEPCELLFHVDSAAALGIIEAVEGDAGADARWRLALRGCHLWLTDLGMDLAARRETMRRLAEGFSTEFHVNSELRRQLGTRYREQRAAIEALVADDWADDHPLAPGFELLARRSRAARPVLDQLLASAAAGRLTASIPDLAASLLHMHVNRVLRAAHRAHELVIYFLLDRMYDSQAAMHR